MPSHWSCCSVSCCRRSEAAGSCTQLHCKNCTCTIYRTVNVTARRRRFSLHGKSKLCLELIHRADRILTQLSLALWIQTQPKYRILGETLLKEQSYGGNRSAFAAFGQKYSNGLWRKVKTDTNMGNINGSFCILQCLLCLEGVWISEMQRLNGGQANKRTTDHALMLGNSGEKIRDHYIFSIWSFWLLFAYFFSNITCSSIIWKHNIFVSLLLALQLWATLFEKVN